jgi:hypothetical protein
MPERQRDRLHTTWQHLTPVDAHHARWVPHRRHLGQELRLDVLSGAEKLERLDPGIVRRLDEILALDDEQPLLFPLAPRLEQPVDQPQLGIGCRRDHRFALAFLGRRWRFGAGGDSVDNTAP